jgi:hypothetical protein
MPPAGFEPVIPASERLQTHALGRAAPLGSAYTVLYIPHVFVIRIKTQEYVHTLKSYAAEHIDFIILIISLILSFYHFFALLY